MERLVKKMALGSTLDDLQAWGNAVLTNTVPDSISGGKAIYTVPGFLQKLDPQHAPEAEVFWENGGKMVFVDVKWESKAAGARWPILWGLILGKPDLQPPTVHMLRTTFRRLKPGIFAYASTVEE
jgi:hypothetical protein